MSTKRSWSSIIGEATLAGTLAFLFTLAALMLLLSVIGVAVAQDQTVATREARLGEQDRSMNYKGQPHYQSEGHIIEFNAYVINRSLPDSGECQDRNMYLHYALIDMAKMIARNPALGPALKDVIQRIHDSWCRK